MSAWTDDPKNFDSIEQDALSWLRTDLGEYLRFHELDGGHLPENFDFVSVASPVDADARVKALRRIGYLSYSVFVNLATAKRAAETVPADFETLLDVYDHVSRVALRIGAAIDISRLLELEHGSLFDGRAAVHQNGGAPKHGTLKATLDDTDAYNNYLKHTGLPPIRIDAGSTTDSVLVPSKLDRSALNAKHTSPWSVAKPDAPVGEQARETISRTMQAFNTFYGSLADTTPARLNNWKAKMRSSARGIGGLLAVEDGYVASKLLMPGSGSFKS